MVDLLGFKENPASQGQYAKMGVSMLKVQNWIVARHVQTTIYIFYTALAQLVNFKGYYLESNPCLFCNNL